jgi:uncharacterized protein (DUF2141 family)
MYPRLTKSLCVAAAVIVTTLATQAAAQTGELTVTATYKGKGAVDVTHEILVFLFDHPTPTAESQPLGVQSITQSGGSTTFKGLPTTPHYVVLVYDENANYDGQSGPPPVGTPWSTHSKSGKPIAITPGANVKVAATFDDSRRWK